MHLLLALVVGLTAGLLAVQDCKDEKWTEEKEKYEKIVDDEYLRFAME